jgi:WD40 repeat protein
MKIIVIYFLLFQSILGVAQEIITKTIETEFINSFNLEADEFIGTDDFENIYYIKNNVIYKKTALKTYTYSNTQFGGISSIDIKNPLKILLFYSDFNTAIILDNNLNELTSPINFTSESFSKNISFSSISSNNNLWLFSLDDNIIRLWNYQTKKVQFASQPATFYVENFETLQQLSSYKNCWLFGDNVMLKFNEYGTFGGVFEIDKFDEVHFSENNIIFSNNNRLIIYDSELESLPIKLNQEILIKSFYFNKNQIYIFDGLKIFVFKIIKI